MGHTRERGIQGKEKTHSSVSVGSERRVTLMCVTRSHTHAFSGPQLTTQRVAKKFDFAKPTI